MGSSKKLSAMAGWLSYCGDLSELSEDRRPRLTGITPGGRGLRFMGECCADD